MLFSMVLNLCTVSLSPDLDSRLLVLFCSFFCFSYSCRGTKHRAKTVTSSIPFILCSIVTITEYRKKNWNQLKLFTHYSDSNSTAVFKKTISSVPLKHLHSCVDAGDVKTRVHVLPSFSWQSLSSGEECTQGWPVCHTCIHLAWRSNTETQQTMFSYMTNVSGGLFFYCVTVRGTNVMTGSWQGWRDRQQQSKSLIASLPSRMLCVP